ncbi:degenerin-like protein asic-1 [Palaemon carinicauda]|uniref:degenerin-like protein asic-1 n=1 Tax=Palaemon carinicauda TaxID=392227 RepID=UPI0035B65634
MEKGFYSGGPTKKKSLVTKFASDVGDFADSCSAHGIGKIYKSQGWARRLLWILVCVCMVAFGTYQCYRVIAEYLTYPKKVSISIKEESVVEFPAVTVCNLNSMANKEMLRNHSIWGAFVEVEDLNPSPECDDLNFSDDYDFYDEDSSIYDGSGSGDEDYWNPDDNWTPQWDEDGNIEWYDDSGFGGESGSGYSGDSSESGTTADTQVVDETTGSTQETDNTLGSTLTTYTTLGSTLTPYTMDENSSESFDSFSYDYNSSGGTIVKREAKSIHQSSQLKEIPKEQQFPKIEPISPKKSPRVKSSEPNLEERLVLPNGESTLPKQPSGGSGHIMPFTAFSKLHWRKFAIPTPQRRHKRQASKTETSTPKPDPIRLKKSTVLLYRQSCSLYYKYLQYLKEDDSIAVGESVKFTSDRPNNCPLENYKEDVTYNPVCALEVFCDNFGCFDYNMQDYKETTKYDEIYKEWTRCPSCAQDCWPISSFESWQKGNLNAVQVSSIFQSSRSPDFSDILGTFIPSKADIEAYSLSAQDFIQTCSFDRRACSHKQFHTWTSDKYGQCYTFNSAFRKVVHKKKDKNETGNAIPRKTSSIGPMSGIRLTLNINAKDYVSLLSPDVGARIIVHSPHLLPFPEDEGFNISPGLSVSVSISLKKILRVGQPYGKCEDKTSSEIFKEYSAVTCRKVCLEREFWNTCGCFSGQSPVYNDKYHEKPSRQCSPFNVTQSTCLIIAYGIPSGPGAVSLLVANAESNYLSVKVEFWHKQLDYLVFPCISGLNGHTFGNDNIAMVKGCKVSSSKIANQV